MPTPDSIKAARALIIRNALSDIAIERLLEAVMQSGTAPPNLATLLMARAACKSATNGIIDILHFDAADGEIFNERMSVGMAATETYRREAGRFAAWVERRACRASSASPEIEKPAELAIAGRT